MLAGIRDILIISTKEDLSKYEALLGNGSSIGIKLSYKVQPSPDGLAQAFILGESFIGDNNICLILGDNVFFGNGLPKILKKVCKRENNQNAVVFGYYVNDPERYGVVDFDIEDYLLLLKKNQKTQRVTMLYRVYTFIQMMLLKLLKLKNHQLEGIGNYRCKQDAPFQ